MKNISVIARSVIVILLAGLFILLVTQNLEMVKIRFIALEASVPLIGVILVSLFSGLVIGNVLSGMFILGSQGRKPSEKQSSAPGNGNNPKKEIKGQK